MKVLVLSADQFEDPELVQPLDHLRHKGVEVTVAAPHTGRIHGRKGAEVEVDIAIDAVEPADYDLLFLPGGKAPAQLRRLPAVLDLVRHFVEAGKPVAAICHGPQILISADVVHGKRMTGYHSVQGELTEAGARVVDAEVVVDGKLLTSRQPGDMPAFLRELDKLLAGPGQAPQVGRRA